MFSILIPTYNYNVTNLVAELVQQAVNDNIVVEIIVIDDCSTCFKEENKSILQHSNVKYVENEINLGRTATRMKLAKMAKYELLLFLDADVIPLNDNFLKLYYQYSDKPVVCGGVSYKNVIANEDEYLRYKYGKFREELPYFKGVKKEDFLLSANCLIKKSVFLKVNTELQNFYGSDIIISHNLKKNNYSIFSIYNPVIHYGLESSETFFKKSLEAISSIVNMEKSGILPDNFTKLQLSYKKLKSFGMISLISLFLMPFQDYFKTRIINSKPNLRYFDLYRLLYYIKLKK